MDIGGLWEVAEYAGETLVFVGVVGEVLAERQLIFAKNQLRRDAIEGLSSWILIVGLAVSLAALIGTNEHFNGTMAGLQRQAAESNKRAGEANERAAKANERAKQLENSTQRLKTDAEESDEIAEAERLARVKLEQRLEWRRINRNQFKRAVSVLRPFAGSVVALRVVGGDPEEQAFASDLQKMFKDAHWDIRVSRIGTMAIMGTNGVIIPTGLACQIDESPAGKALADVLRKFPSASVTTTGFLPGVVAAITLAPKPPP